MRVAEHLARWCDSILILLLCFQKIFLIVMYSVHTYMHKWTHKCMYYVLFASLWHIHFLWMHRFIRKSRIKCVYVWTIFIYIDNYVYIHIILHLQFNLINQFFNFIHCLLDFSIIFMILFISKVLPCTKKNPAICQGV